MMTAPRKGRRLLGASVRCLAVAGLASAGAVSKAQAETTRSVQATASAAYDSNPFLFFGNDNDTASFRLEVVPTLARVDEVSSLSVSAQAEYIEYASQFDPVQNGSITLAASEDLSERLQMSASFSVASTIITQNNNLQPSGEAAGADGQPTLPIANDLLLDEDITLLGRRQRTNSVNARGSLSYALSQYDAIEWSAVTNVRRVASGNGLNDSNFTEQRLGINHRFNDDLVVGGAVAASFSSFSEGGQGDARVFSPQIFVSAQLSPRISATGNFGVSFVRTEALGGAVNSRAFSGTGSVCYKDNRNNLCLNGQRQVLPSAIGQVLTQTVASVSYSTRLSERDTLQFGGSHSLASSPFGVASRDLESIRVYGRFERMLRERIRLFVNAGYSDTSDSLNDRRSNVQGSIGISMTFGNSR